MFANPAAQRAPLFLMILLFLCASAVTFAGDEEKSGYLGVYLQDLEPSMAKALQLDDEGGVLVTDVVDDGPAEKAGLEGGDVILVFDGEDTGTSKVLRKVVRQAEPGDEVKVVVLRGGDKKTLKVTVGENDDEFVWHVGEGGDFHVLKDLKGLKELKGLKRLKEGEHSMRAFKFHGDDDAHIEVITKGDLHDIWVDGDQLHLDSDRGFLGIVPRALNEQLGEYFGVEDGEGVLVSEIVEDSGAEKAGLKAGDVIVRIGDDEIKNTADLHEAMEGTEAEQKVKVEVLRKGDRKKFDVTLGEMSETQVFRHIEVLGDDDDQFTIRAPHIKMMPHLEKHFEHRDGDEDVLFFSTDDDEDLEELKGELEKLKQELKKIQEELDK